MANHRVFDRHGTDISLDDTWQALVTEQLPDGIALTNISLIELLQEQRKESVLIPLSDLLTAQGKMANGLLQQVRDLLAQHSSRLGVWITANTDADDLPDIKDFLLTQDLIVIHMPSFVDGRGFSFAQTLRQLGYEGEIRMAGAFGRDQIAYLLRAGADSFVLNEHDLKSDISQAFTALASSYDGRDASALPMFSKT